MQPNKLINKQKESLYGHWYTSNLSFTVIRKPVSQDKWGFPRGFVFQKAQRSLLNSSPISCFLYGRKWRGTKKPFNGGERGEWKRAGLKLNIQKMIMESGPITSWKIDGETMETVTDFIFLGSKITADGDYSHTIKRRLLLGKKTMTNLDSAETLLCWQRSI